MAHALHRWARFLVGGLALGAAAAAAEEVAIGAPAPDFDLLGTDGKKHALAGLLQPAKQTAPAALAVVFTCNSCPFAQAYEPVLLELASRYSDVPFVLINPNDPKGKPEDSYEKMQERAREKEYPFPYLFDATQAVARAYGARVTPHIFVVDTDKKVRYRGRISDSHESAKVTSHDLVAALDALRAGEDIAVTSTRAFGCSIKWKKEP